MTLIPRVISNTFLFFRITSSLKSNLNLSLTKYLSSIKTPDLNMDKLEIVPDVIDKAPETELQVTYDDDITVQVGGVLTPTQVKNKPKVHYIADPKAFYLLCMTDPDAPSRKNPLAREWHHWLVGNIPGNNVTAGEVLSDYIGAGPPEETGLHRYVFLVYKQPGKLTFDEPRLTNRSGDGRAHFSIKKFARKYKLGEPIAGNVFQAEWDTYVPELYNQLGA